MVRTSIFPFLSDLTRCAHDTKYPTTCPCHVLQMFAGFKLCMVRTSMFPFLSDLTRCAQDTKYPTTCLCHVLQMFASFKIRVMYGSYEHVPLSLWSHKMCPWHQISHYISMSCVANVCKFQVKGYVWFIWACSPFSLISRGVLMTPHIPLHVHVMCCKRLQYNLWKTISYQ